MSRARHLGEREVLELSTRSAASGSPAARHLSTCESCRRKVAATDRLLRTMTAGPPTDLEQLLALAPRLAGRRPRVEPVGARLLAERRPGADASAPPGLRLAAAATRQWLFGAGELDVDVQAFPEGPEADRLHGQVAGARGPAPDLPVHLRHAGAALMAVTDAHGEFSFEGVAGDAVSLIVETDDAVHRIDLGILPCRPVDDET